MQILVADDDPVYRSLLQGQLEESHFEVVLACDGVEAWNILQRPDAPTLALLDWNMPPMEGYEVCRRIRQIKGNAIPYILMVTSNSSRDELLKVLVAGADDYLLKPFEPLDLKIRLRTAVRILSLQDRLEPAGIK